jgi:hypothetical protein
MTDRLHGWRGPPTRACAAAYGEVVVLGLIVGLFGQALAADPAHLYPKLFGTNETRSDNIKTFPKWTDMLWRHSSEQKRGDPPCTPTRFFALFGGGLASPSRG